MSSSICNPCGWEAATAGSNSYFPTPRPCSLPGLSRARTGRGLPPPAPPPPRRPPSPPLHPILRSPRAQCGKYEFPLSFLGNFRSSSFSRSPLRPPPLCRPLPARPLRPWESRRSSRSAPQPARPPRQRRPRHRRPAAREGRQSPGGGPGSAPGRLGRTHGAGRRDLQQPPPRLPARCGAQPGAEQRRGPLAAAEGMPERHKAGGGSSPRLVPGWGRRAGFV